MRLGALFAAGWWIVLGCDGAAEREPCAVCADDERCEVAAGAAACEAVCLPPRAPRFAEVPLGTTLTFAPGALVALTASDVTKVPAEAWQATEHVTLAAVGTMTLHARWQTRPPACAADAVFETRYEVVERLPQAAEAATASDAVAADDARISAWASGWVRPTHFGSDLDATWKAIERALGPATGKWDDAVSLGNGGALVFTFDAPFGDRQGLDLAVFENGFSPAFLELAYVEVSSDGEHFARFPSLSLQSEAVASYGTLDASELVGVAGRYAGGFGTGFDLAWLADDDAVLTGRVDLGAIAFVRIVDIVGDGLADDAFGHPIYDPTPTFGPAGFDVEAIGVMQGTAIR